MLRSEEEWLLVVDAFYSAAMSGDWHGALEKLAAATGSRVGELIGLGSANTVPFNWVTDLDQEWLDDFIAIGGGNPEINPFVRAGTGIPELKVLQSADFVTPEERRSNPFMADHAARFDVTHVCLTPLIKEQESLIGLAVMRSTSQGEITPQQREVFTAMAPHIRAAVRMQMALEHQGAQIMAGALEALSLAVFICDKDGKVRAMTSAAECIASAGNTISLRQGTLSAPHRRETLALNEAIRVAAGGLIKLGAPQTSVLLIRGKDNNALALDVLPLPRRDFTFGFEPRALVVVRGAQNDVARIKVLLQMAYGLTSAEAEVAMLLTDGHFPELIAQTRNTSIATVRVQIRSVYSKLGVHRQVELSHLINQLR